MTQPTLALVARAAGGPLLKDIVLDDADALSFLLSQPDPVAALRDSLRLGVQSLRLAAQPWPDREDGGFRSVGAAA